MALCVAIGARNTSFVEELSKPMKQEDWLMSIFEGILVAQLVALSGQYKALIVCWKAEERNAQMYYFFFVAATIWFKRNLCWFFPFCFVA